MNEHQKKDTELHMSVINLGKSAVEMSQKIKDQTLILEAIKTENNKQTAKIGINTKLFEKAVVDLESDRRNHIIGVLIIVIMLLLWYLKL